MNMSRMNRRDMLRMIAGGVGMVAFGLTSSNCADIPHGSAKKTAKRPNIVLILADDLGYSDIGCFGGEIATPNLDSMAKEGIRFTQFYNCARCCPSRASLLTGLYPHQTGLGFMAGVEFEHGMTGEGFEHGTPGYLGYLNRNCVTLAEALKPVGYHTLMVGKWHVGAREGMLPVDRGFDEYYGILQGASNYFRVDELAMLRRNRETVESKGEKYYTTDAFTDYAVKFIDEYAHKDDNPYFLYAAYTAPHWPLHAFPEDIVEYKGKYMVGWDEVRRRRFDRQKELGLITPDAVLTQRDLGVEPWDSITAKEEWDLRMAVYAAMVDRMDQNIGRILDAIKRSREEENTIVMFLSDNGACPEPVERTPGISPGPAESFSGYLLPWANASNTPFRKYKHWVHEGGIATPFIVKWPAVIRNTGAITSQVGHVIDVMATYLNVAGADYPKTYNGNDIFPLEGKSLLPIFEGKTRAGHGALFWEHEGNRAVRQGRWKLVSKYSDMGIHFGNDVTRYPNDWELYDMEADRLEMNNLAAKYPRRVQAMGEMYDRWAKRCFVEPWELLYTEWLKRHRAR